MEQDIKSSNVRAKIQFHLNEAKRLQDAFDLLIAVSLDDCAPVVKDMPQTDKIAGFDFSKLKPITSGTFKDVIGKIYDREQAPLLTKTAMDLYSKWTNKTVSYNTFSGQFSGLSTRDTFLKKIIIPENPLPSRYYFAPSKWFDGNNLKDEYMKKIKPEINPG